MQSQPTPTELFMLENWVAENPGSRQFLRLAQIYLELGRLEEAISLLRRGLVLNPAMVQARDLLAQALERSGDGAGAAAQLLAAVDTLRERAAFLPRLATLLDGLGRTDDAEWVRYLGEVLSQGLIGDQPGQDRAALRAAAGEMEDQAAMRYRSLLGGAANLSPPGAAASFDRGQALARLETLERAARRRATGNQA